MKNIPILGGIAFAMLMLVAGPAFAQARVIVGTSNLMPGCEGLFNSQTREPVFYNGRRLALNDKCGSTALRATFRNGKITIPSAKATCSEAAILGGSC